MQNTKKTLGQFMTPKCVADLLASQVPGHPSSAIDFAAGDCSLLMSLQAIRPGMKLYGFEIDTRIQKKAKKLFPNAHIINRDGLIAIPRIATIARTGIAVVGNPPFTEINPSQNMQKLLLKAFPGLTCKLGRRRSELYFLARSLILAKANHGSVTILMPMGVADGDTYRQYRQILMTQYSLRQVIEIPANAFQSTEARTVLLVIDTNSKGGGNIEIGRYCIATNEVEIVFNGALQPGDRLDARFHEGRMEINPNIPTLQDVGVTIVRGRLSRKEAHQKEINVVHTTDLAQASSGKLGINIGNSNPHGKNVGPNTILAKAGDILLSRTGSRVCMKPFLVKFGSHQITDHVFRIRAPKQSKQLVVDAFMHPAFPGWLNSISKGVCATVLTKRELLSMPLFSIIGK